MDTLQSTASQRFLSAMGTMIEDETAMKQVLYCIDMIKNQRETPLITSVDLDQNAIPLEKAMNELREKVYEFYQLKQQ